MLFIKQKLWILIGVADNFHSIFGHFEITLKFLTCTSSELEASVFFIPINFSMYFFARVVICKLNYISLVYLFPVFILEAGVLHELNACISIWLLYGIRTINLYMGIVKIDATYSLHFLFSFIPHSKFNCSLHNELENGQLPVLLLYLSLKVQA